MRSPSSSSSSPWPLFSRSLSLLLLLLLQHGFPFLCLHWSHHRDRRYLPAISLFSIQSLFELFILPILNRVTCTGIISYGIEWNGLNYLYLLLFLFPAPHGIDPMIFPIFSVAGLDWNLNLKWISLTPFLSFLLPAYLIYVLSLGRTHTHSHTQTHLHVHLCLFLMLLYYIVFYYYYYVGK